MLDVQWQCDPELSLQREKKKFFYFFKSSVDV